MRRRSLLVPARRRCHQGDGGHDCTGPLRFVAGGPGWSGARRGLEGCTSRPSTGTACPPSSSGSDLEKGAEKMGEGRGGVVRSSRGGGGGDWGSLGDAGVVFGRRLCQARDTEEKEREKQGSWEGKRGDGDAGVIEARSSSGGRGRLIFRPPRRPSSCPASSRSSRIGRTGRGSAP